MAKRRSRGAWVLATALAAGCAQDPEGWTALGTDSGATETHGDASEDGSSGDAASSSGDAGAETDADADAGTSTTGETSDPAADDDATPPPEDVPRVRVEPGETKDAELVKTLPVGQTEAGAQRRVVLRLAPDDLPDLEAGDVLITPAEVQVTTRCDVGQTAPGCGYDPQIRAQIILTGDPDDLDPSGPESHALSAVQTQTCTKGEHHCMFVFRASDATNPIEGALDLPCIASGDCHVNLVMWAWDAQARPGGQDAVIVGGNEGNYLDNGIVESDKARLMAVRERGIEADERHELETSGGGNASVPTNASPVLVYAHELAAAGETLAAGEQFVVEAKIVASVGGRARFSTEMFLTTDAGATDGGGLDATAPKQIGEHNGINCLPGQNPCITRKVGVLRVAEDIVGPVFVNVVVKSAVPGGGTTSVTVQRGDGWLRSTGYAAQHHG